MTTSFDDNGSAPGKSSPVSWKQAAWIGIAAAFALSFLTFFLADLSSGDETRVAGICAEMAIEGDPAVPKLNGHPFLEYPPLYYWIAAGVMQLTGVTCFAARFPAALALFLCGITGFFFAKRLRFSPLAALAAEAMILTNFNFLKMSRRAMVDLPLAAMILLAVASFYAMRGEKSGRLRFLFFVLFAAALTAGGYLKGILGVGLPVAVLGVWLLWCDIAGRKFRFLSYIALGTGFLLALGAVSLWYLALARRGGGLCHTALMVNNFGRFSGGQGDHVESWYYYLPRLPQMFQPYLIVLLLAFWKFTRPIWREKRTGQMLLFTASLLPLVIFHLSAAKRSVYLLPLFSFWALFAAPLADEIPRLWRRRFAPLKPLKALWSAAGVAAAGVILFDIVYASITAKNDGMADCYRYLKSREAAGKEVILLSPTERSRGAVWFYLHHGTKERFRALPVNGAETPPEQEVWLWREKRQRPAPGLRSWHDSHWTRG